MTRIELCEERIHGLRWQNGDIPVLAVHGWLDNAGSFVPMGSLLSGMDVVAIDLPGHGLSAPRPDGTRYHIDDYVFDLLAIMDDLGWAQANLLGHSLGGAVCTLTAAAAPQRIASLALIEGLGPLTHPARQTAQQWRTAIERSRPRRRRVHATRAAAVAARSQGRDLDTSSDELLAERGLIREPEGWRWRHDVRLTWPSSHRYTEEQILDLLQNIEAPTVSIRANPASGIFDATRYRKRLAAMVNGQDRDGGSGGHHLHMQHPERIAKIIVEHFHDPA